METFIKGISCYLPEKLLTNEMIAERFPEWSVDKVASKVGINQRHIATDDETAGDMAEKAARRLFEQYSIRPEEIDFVLLCTQSPDYFLPTTACMLQQRLGIPTTAGAIDYNLGCSGYVYGLALAKGLATAGIAKNILLLTAETYSKYIHPTDKGNQSIFGDGATASLISATDGLLEIGEFALGTDGNGAENLIVRTGCSRHRQPKGVVGKDEGGYVEAPDYLYMNGSEIFNFTLTAVPALVKRTLEANSLTQTDVDLTVLHQANKFILSTLRKVMGIPKDCFYINLETTGNTVSNSLPIALKNLLDEHRISNGQRILIAGFGVGYSYGATILTAR